MRFPQAPRLDFLRLPGKGLAPAGVEGVGRAEDHGHEAQVEPEHVEGVVPHVDPGSENLSYSGGVLSIACLFPGVPNVDPDLLLYLSYQLGG